MFSRNLGCERAGFRPAQFSAGVRDLSSVPLTQKQLDSIVAKAVSVSPPQPDIEPKMALQQIVTDEDSGELAPEVSDAEPETNAKPEPVEVQAPVTDPELQERATDYVRRLSGAFLQGLENYKLPRNRADLKLRKTELFTALLDLIEQSGEFLATAHVAKMVDFAEQHEVVRIECRAASDRRKELQLQLGPADGILRASQNKLANARELLEREIGSQPRLEDYPSSKELRAWESRIEKARTALDAASADEAGSREDRNDIVREIRAQDELLNGSGDQPGLKARELDLRAAKDGKPRRDYSTGLVIPAEF